MDLNKRKINMDNIYAKIPHLLFPTYREKDVTWLEEKVGDIIETITPPKKLQTSDYLKKGNYPVIDQSQVYICGYTNDIDAIVNKGGEDLIIFGDHTCILKFVDFPFVQGADGIKIIKTSNSKIIETRYLYQFLQSSPIESKEYKRHFSELKEKKVVFPNNTEYQRKIANGLFLIDKEIELQTTRMNLFKQYKKGLMQQIFP